MFEIFPRIFQRRREERIALRRHKVHRLEEDDVGIEDQHIRGDIGDDEGGIELQKLLKDPADTRSWGVEVGASSEPTASIDLLDNGLWRKGKEILRKPFGRVSQPLFRNNNNSPDIGCILFHTFNAEFQGVEIFWRAGNDDIDWLGS